MRTMRDAERQVSFERLAETDDDLGLEGKAGRYRCTKRRLAVLGGVAGVVIVVVVVILIASVHSSPDAPPVTDPPPEVCDVSRPVQTTVTLINEIYTPTFELSVNLTNVSRPTAIGFLEAAADTEGWFHFTLAHQGGDHGYALVEVNGVRGGNLINTSHWQLLDASGSPLKDEDADLSSAQEIRVEFRHALNTTAEGLEELQRWRTPLAKEACHPHDLHNVTLEIHNFIHDVTFIHEVTFPRLQRTTVLGLLERAASLNKYFRFEASYRGREVGFVVEEINGLRGRTSDGAYWYWRLSSALSVGRELAVDAYWPADKERMQFIFTKGS